jgi:hypothetical protein
MRIPMHGRSWYLLAFLLGAARPAEGQRLAASPFISYQSEMPALVGAVPPSRAPDLPRLLLGGVLGGVAGVFAGGIVGAKLTDGNCEDCGLEGAAYGLVVGGSALLPLGVHLANGRRGNFGRALLASLAIGAAGFGAALGTNRGEIMLAVPVLQLISSVAIERATGR